MVQTPFPETHEEYKISRLGMMGEAGLEFPSNRLFFVDVAAPNQFGAGR